LGGQSVSETVKVLTLRSRGLKVHRKRLADRVLGKPFGKTQSRKKVPGCSMQKKISESVEKDVGAKTENREPRKSRGRT